MYEYIVIQFTLATLDEWADNFEDGGAVIIDNAVFLDFWYMKDCYIKKADVK